MAEQERSQAEERPDEIAHEIHTRLGCFRSGGIGYTPESATDQDVDFEPDQVPFLAAGPGFTPEGQTDLEQEELSGTA